MSKSLEYLSQKKILIVDDVLENRLLLKKYFESIPVILHEAENGKIACDMVANEQYEIVLMDIQMPVMDGYSAIAYIRKELLNEDVYIIAISGYTLHEEIEKVLNIGANYHLAKPISKRKLIDYIITLYENNALLLSKYEKPKDDTVQIQSLDDFIPQYIFNRKTEASMLIENLENFNLNGISKIAHSIKGHAASYGFNKLQELAERLDRSCKSGPNELIIKDTQDMIDFIQKM